MDQSLLKNAAIQSVALMLAVITLSYGIQHYQTITISASNILNGKIEIKGVTADSDGSIPLADNVTDNQNMTETDTPSDTKITEVEKLLGEADQSIIDQLGDKFLMIKKPEGTNLKVNLEDLYIEKSIRLTLEGISDNEITSSLIYRLSKGELFQGDPLYTETITVIKDEEDGNSEEVITRDYGRDLSHGVTIAVKTNPADGLYSANILIELDTVYAHNLYEDANYYFIDLKKPSEVYDKILVVDAGHGGKDVGAISKDNKYYEKNINAEIALQLKQLLDKEKIKVYYTRTGDSTVFLRPRVTLANAVDADYFISIHCNSNELTSPNGLEVLYYDTEFNGVKSFDLAKLFSEEIGKTITLRQRGVIEKHKDDIYIMDKAAVPMILIEVGYLSNRLDMDYLSKEENQKAVAQGIYNGIMKAYDTLAVTR